MFRENIIHLPRCTVIKMPASRIDRKDQMYDHMDKDMVKQSNTVPKTSNKKDLNHT